MSRIILILLVTVLPGQVCRAGIETDSLKEAWFYVWSSCANCCESGEGVHYYVSNVVKANNSYDFDKLGGAFYQAVNKDYPNGAPNGSQSNAFTSQADAQKDRQELLRDWKSGYFDEQDQVHEISIN